MVLFLIIFALLLLTGSVEANSIQKISMDIFIEDNGDAKITESWECYTNEGTEVYHPYYNLGNSEIKDLTVSEGNRKYTTLSKWNVNGSLSSKANKCGINELTDGVELCWVISSYGSHTYTVKYTITNFVSYDYIVFVHMCSDNGISMARHAQREAIERANNYSSGGGGSFGGGSSGGEGFR